MTDNRTTELLPCPFCGGEADVMLSQSRWGQSYTIHHDALGKCPAEYVSSMQFATEAEAIAAWNARVRRGTLTADDIRGLIERHSDESGDNGRDFHNGAYVAIADELNARAERTCHNTHENRWFKCSACGYGFTDLYAEDEGDINEQPRYCPNCGAKVVGE